MYLEQLVGYCYGQLFGHGPSSSVTSLTSVGLRPPGRRTRTVSHLNFNQMYVCICSATIHSVVERQCLSARVPDTARDGSDRTGGRERRRAARGRSVPNPNTVIPKIT